MDQPREFRVGDALVRITPTALPPDDLKALQMTAAELVRLLALLAADLDGEHASRVCLVSALAEAIQKRIEGMGR